MDQVRLGGQDLRLTNEFEFQDEKKKFKMKAEKHVEKHRREHIADIDEEHLAEASQRTRERTRGRIERAKEK